MACRAAATLCAWAGLPSDIHRAELREALASPPPEGDHWCGRTVARWMAERLGPLSAVTLAGATYDGSAPAG